MNKLTWYLINFWGIFSAARDLWFLSSHLTFLCYTGLFWFLWCNLTFDTLLWFLDGSHFTFDIALARFLYWWQLTFLYALLWFLFRCHLTFQITFLRLFDRCHLTFAHLGLLNWRHYLALALLRSIFITLI